ncbi:MAG: CopG family transcriptional regulator [Chlamydiae bacterium]|nr:CopG family transcriptional regulator [Chlamydiota bacterium]MBI3276389.1 CopG family transcriptional regulator [Chlamydiota bacterium]
MNKNKIDRVLPLGKLSRIRDFLPPPSALVLPDRNVKVTISLSELSVKFFKHEANRHHTKYQKLIRKVLDQYATFYEKAG